MLRVADRFVEEVADDPVVTPPAIEWIAVKGDEQVDPADVVEAKAELVDPEDGQLNTQWVLRPESGEYSTGGDFRPMLPDVEGAIIESNGDTARVRQADAWATAAAKGMVAILAAASAADPAAATGEGRRKPRRKRGWIRPVKSSCKPKKPLEKRWSAAKQNLQPSLIPCAILSTL